MPRNVEVSKGKVLFRGLYVGNSFEEVGYISQSLLSNTCYCQ